MAIKTRLGFILSNNVDDFLSIKTRVKINNIHRHSKSSYGWIIKIINKLEANNILKRVSNKKSKRENLIILTDKGEKFYRLLTKLMEEVNNLERKTR